METVQKASPLSQLFICLCPGDFLQCAIRMTGGNRPMGSPNHILKQKGLQHMRILLTFGIVLSAIVLIAADDGKKDGKFDAGKLVGDWNYVSGTKSGETVDKNRLQGKVTFTKDTITLPADENQKFVMAYKIDSKVSPATIDMEIKDGPVKEGKAEGIIAVEGDELKLCYVPTFAGGKRPTKFESTKDNSAFFFVLKKAK